ncbi:uncharacterized protein LOC123699571 [Colias croceus]|uniref:uncharacterized protein LOC123699571 n=1 Tax=Colias crocea TaxID=72248 RepID=UPI001E2807ED|nr:uncharacterized protein LOC123699571 [Colias croceus]
MPCATVVCSVVTAHLINNYDVWCVVVKSAYKSVFTFKMNTAHCLRVTIITLILKSINCETSREESVPCGGRLKGPVGTIQTPNFPNPFPVPLKCKWIIEHEIANGTISIYFTQQYTTSGLTFTEYMYYDDTYKLGERRALTVTEENITRIKYLQVQSPVLVVELSLSRAEGSQLRALGLLSVFGLNVTYAVRAPAAPAPTTSCSAIECRLLGHCYASHDYSEFFCSCFDGYSGPDCGVGPLCPSTSNMCKNKGTCRQMGPAAVSCICAPGYTGDLCESEIATPECGIEECLEGCKGRNNCDCSPKDSDSLAARFETSLQIKDMANGKISEEIIEKVTKYLRGSNITLQDDIEILYISSPDPNGVRTVWLRVWGLRKEAGAVRSALSRLVSNTNSNTLPLLPAALELEMQPALSLHKLIINQHPEVWEGGEFILSCMAYGSPNIAFTWYKDGVKINFNGTSRDIWTRTVAEDALGRRMSVLGISEAKKLDGGKWACAAVDAGRRRCSALRLSVFRPPNIRLVPSTLTVNKGDNVSITCLAGAGRVHGTLGFSWARERNLLALAPGREVWEDLYPAGSVLKLYNVQKSAEYSCQVSSVAGTNSKAVTVWAVGSMDDVCESEASHGLRWPQTAPGAYAIASCPSGSSGETTRFCEPKTTTIRAKWNQPNFSGCIDDSLQDIYEQFTLISYGYSWVPVNDIARQYGSVLRSLPGHPGTATVPLQHASSMLEYLRSMVANATDRVLSAEPLLRIYDSLLKHRDAFLDEQKIYQLQNLIVKTAIMKSDLDFRCQEFVVQTKSLQEDKGHFSFPLNQNSEEWLLTSVDVEVAEGSENVIAVVNYNDLSARLPSLRRTMELKGSREIEYHMASTQSQVWSDGNQDDSKYTITLLFIHAKNYSAIESRLACALRTASDPSTWSRSACEVRVPEPTHVSCRCRGLGTYALFTIAPTTLTDAERDLREIVKVTIGIAAALCLLAAVILLLTLGGQSPRLPVLLRVVTATAHATALLALLDCDTRQEEACPGAAGWACAASWCAGSAALCAQPLLLQAELAGRSQRASSVGILAGFSVLCWLSARLWGGAALQLGAGALAALAAGCGLLALLALALALCAARRLRLLARKVPADRRPYLTDRMRIVRHTLILLVTCSAVQVAGVAHAQRGEPRLPRAAALAVAALLNGISILTCYVLCETESARCLRRMCHTCRVCIPRPPQRDTTLSLFIKQNGEAESRGGMGFLETSSSQATPMSTYWRFESPSKINRKLSSPLQEDGRADIIRCVEYKTPSHGRSITTQACDLIPDYIGSSYIELGKPKNTREITSPLLPQEISKECSLCIQSNPDISKLPLPIKSCLKKTKNFASTVSLPSEDAPNTDIMLVNKKWNKAYPPDTDQMMNKITNDLDFLLNRNKRKDAQIEEAPT